MVLFSFQIIKSSFYYCLRGSIFLTASANLPYVNGDPAVTLYAVWDLTNPNYTVRYDGNGADTGVGVMDNIYHTNVNPGDTFDLFASNFKRDGYGFAGWNTKADGTGTSYGPNQMVTVDADFQANKDKINQTITLYANWIAPAKDVLDNTLTFQTANLLSIVLDDGTTLASKPNGYVIALKDARDDQVYAVAKLADGNYWLIENLRLDNTPELSATNTNAPSLPLTNNYSSSTTSNYLSATANSWCTGNNASCDDQSMLNTTNTTWNAGGTYSPSQTQSVTSASAHTDHRTCRHFRLRSQRFQCSHPSGSRWCESSCRRWRYRCRCGRAWDPPGRWCAQK